MQVYLHLGGGRGVQRPCKLFATCTASGRGGRGELAKPRKRKLNIETQQLLRLFWKQNLVSSSSAPPCPLCLVGHGHGCCRSWSLDALLSSYLCGLRLLTFAAAPSPCGSKSPVSACGVYYRENPLTTGMGVNTISCFEFHVGLPSKVHANMIRWAVFFANV